MAKKLDIKKAKSSIDAISAAVTTLAIAFDLSENGGDFITRKVMELLAGGVSAVYSEEHTLKETIAMADDVEQVFNELKGGK